MNGDRNNGWGGQALLAAAVLAAAVAYFAHTATSPSIPFLLAKSVLVVSLIVSLRASFARRRRDRDE